MEMCKPILKVLLAVVIVNFVSIVNAADINVNGFFNGGAILVVEGKHRLMRVGETSPEGVALVAANKTTATIEFNGEQQVLRKGKAFQNQFEAPETATARILEGRGGHYLTPGRINGRTVKFMVDTGATVIAINKNMASSLGLRTEGAEKVKVNTANGMNTASVVMLNSVRIGDIEINNVQAVVTHTDFPKKILLGNSFLSRVDMHRENGVMVLEAHF